MKNKVANRIAPDGTPHFAASHLGLFCLPMSHKRTPGLYGLYGLSMLAIFMVTGSFISHNNDTHHKLLHFSQTENIHKEQNYA